MEDLPIVSTDSHVIEPADLWSGMEDELGDRAPYLQAEPDGDWWYADGRKLMSVSGGAQAGTRFENQAQLDLVARMDEVRHGGYDPAAKIEDMDFDGVRREVIYTTLGLQLFRLPDPRLVEALFRRYNDWMADFAASDPERLAGVALILLDDVEWGVEELKRSAARGLKGAMISVYPEEAKSYDRPEYEPFWATAAGLGLPVSFHIGSNRSVQYPTSEAGQTTQAVKFLSTPAMYTTSAHWVEMSLANMIFAGVFERHPDLKVVSLEHEISWVPHFLQSMDYTYTQRARRPGWHRYADDSLPSDYFRSNVYVSFQEDALGLQQRDLVGVANLVWGSDYPHHETTFPRSREILADVLSDVSPAEREQILVTTPTQLYFS